MPFGRQSTNPDEWATNPPVDNASPIRLMLAIAVVLSLCTLPLPRTGNDVARLVPPRPAHPPDGVRPVRSPRTAILVSTVPVPARVCPTDM